MKTSRDLRPNPLTLRPVACCVLLAFCEAATANPTGPNVAAGAASFQDVGKTLNVTNAPGTIINWQGFSIGSAEHTRFIQQSAASAVLNRVVGANPSSLLGALTSNGRVFLVNPNGIVFGAGSRIDTAGFIASTLNITDKNFLEGRLKFEGGGNGVLRNEGAIRASGDIMFVGPTIENTGSIISEQGSVLLAAGRKITITSPDAQGVRFELQAPTDSALNVGSIEAASSAAMFAGTLRHSGDIRATGASVSEGGKVTLIAQKDVIVDKGATVVASGLNGGSVKIQSGDLTMVSGLVEAKGSEGAGGTIHILGHHVGLDSGATVDASGETGGGTILVGGDYQGKNADVQNASMTYVARGASLRADAITSGNGGKVIVWSDDATRVYGAISAQGGARSGDGGFVETSGHYLDVTSAPSLGAPAGRGGTWLLDPGQFEIVQGIAGVLDANIAGSPAFTPVDPDDPSRITAQTISAALNANANVSISTGPFGPGTGSGNGDIVFNASPSLGGDILIENGPGGLVGSTLTLNAARDIRFSNGRTTFRANDFPVAVLNVNLNAGGGVFTDVLAAVTLQVGGPGGQVTAQVNGGRTWQNSGAISLLPGTSIRLFDGASFATLVNNPGAAISINTNGGFALSSSPGQPNGVVLNGGTINVNTSTSFEAAFSNTGIVNVAASQTLTLPNAQAISGTIDIASGAEVRLSEFYGTPALFENTTITGAGTLSVESPGGFTPVAIFRNVTATDATLNVGQGGIAGFDTAPSSFANVSVNGLGPAGVLISNTGLTIGNALNVSASATFNGPTTVGPGGVLLGGGTLDGTGTLTAPALSWFGGTIAGSGRKTFSSITSNNTEGPTSFTGNLGLNSGEWNNNGLMSQEGGGQLLLSNGSGVNNNLAGTWQLSSTNPTPISSGGGATSTFNNVGTFENSGATTHNLSGIAFLNSGQVNVTAGTLGLPSRAGGADTGDIDVAGGATIVFNGSRALALGADITGLGGNVTIANGTFSTAGNISATGELSVIGTGAAVFNVPLNPSVVNVSGAGSASFNSSVNTDTINVSGGAATFNALTTVGTALNVSGGTTTFTAPATIATVLNVSAGLVDFNAIATMGAAAISGGGTANFDAPALINGGFALSGGALSGTSTVALNGPATWSGGTMTGTGTTTASGGLAISGAGNKDLTGGRTLNNPGTTTWTAGAIRTGDGSTINNTGTWQDQTSGGVIDHALGGADSIFNNTGTYTKSGDGTTVVGSNVTFNNTNPGTVQVQNGTLQLGGGGTDTGSYAISPGATLDIAGGLRSFSAASVPSGAGTLLLSGGTLNVLDGTLPRLDMVGGNLTRSTVGDLTISGEFNASGGTILGGDGNFVTQGNTVVSGFLGIGRPWVNAGSANINSGATVSTNQNVTNNAGAVLGGAGTLNLDSRTLTNNGTVRPGSVTANVVGTLSILGNYTQTAPDGTLEIEIGGNGAGTPDRLAISGVASLAGNLVVVHSGEFLPVSDTNHTIMTYASRTGDFTTKTFPAGYAPFYTAGPDPTSSTSYSLAIGAIVNSWTAAGSGAWDNPNNWSLLHAPTAGEDARIDVGGAAVTETITVSGGNRAARKVTSEENLDISGGGLTLGPLASRVNAALTVSGGTLTTGGTLTANSIAVSSGTLNAAGELISNSIALSGSGLLDAQFGTLPRLNMTGGVLTRSIAGDLTITGPFTVSGGAIVPSATSGKLVTSGNTIVNGVTVGRDWSNTGVLDLNGTMELSGANFTNEQFATLNVNGEGQMSVGGSNLVNAGFLNLNTDPVNTTPFGSFAGGGIKNSGTVTKNLSGLVDLFHPFSNEPTGRVVVNRGTLSVAFGGSQAGTIEIGEGAALNTEGTLVNLPGGTIGGRGTLQLFSGTLLNRGTVRPGSDSTTGTLTILGNFENADTGQVNVRIAGSDPNAVDVLSVSGAATLSGALNVATTGGYSATDGDAFTVLTTSGPLAGTFQTVNRTFGNPLVLAYGPHSLSFSVNAPPLNFWESSTGGSWNDPTRWSLAHVPLATEQVRIDRPGALTIVVPAGVFSADRLRSEENVTVSGGTLDLANRSVINATLALDGGTLQGNGAVTVNGTLALIGGSLTGAGAVTVNGTTAVSGASQLAGKLTTTGFSMPGGSLSVGSAGELDLIGSLEKDISAATLTNNATVNVSGSAPITLRNGAVWQNAGVTNLGGASRIAMSSGGRVVNTSAGVINDNSSSEVLMSGPAGTSFENAGIFNKTVDSASQQFIDPALTNTGTINVAAGTLIATAFPVNSGTIAVSGGATFSTSDHALANQGLLKGTGTFNVGGATLTNKGTVAPGNSPGTMTITGNFTQGPDGTLQIELGGTRQGVDYDLLKVTGAANLGGTLAINVPTGTSVDPSTRYDFMTYASRTGDFTTTTLPPGLTFQGIPGPTSYGATVNGVAGLDPVTQTQVTNFTTRDALVFSDRAFGAEQLSTATESSTSAELEQRRNELQDCR